MSWRYFKFEEFACPCCGKNETDEALIDFLDDARKEAGIPFIITSGYRCPRHNEEIGGKPDSAHLKGLAADILCRTSQERFKIVQALIWVGFRRIGIGKNFVHADLDFDKPYPVIWLY